MKRIFSEAKGEGPGRRLEGVRRSAGPREGIRSPANIDPSNIEVYKAKVGEPRDSGMRDQMRLQSLFIAGLKLVYRTGRGPELDRKIKAGTEYHEVYKSEKRALDRELNPPSAFGRTPEINWRAVEEHRGNINEFHKKMKLWNVIIEGDLVDLINGAVTDIFNKASISDLNKIANIKTFEELPDLASLQITNVDEAELLSNIFFKNKTEKATPEEVQSNIKNIVRSFIKLDTERMDEEDTISNIINRLKTLTKTASVNRSELRGSARSNVDPHAGYKRAGIDVAAKRKITSAFSRDDLQEVRAQLSMAGREDLANMVGKKQEADIMRSYISGEPLSEGYTFNYDVIVERLLCKYKKFT